jgi:hypothetical protein
MKFKETDYKYFPVTKHIQNVNENRKKPNLTTSISTKKTTEGNGKGFDSMRSLIFRFKRN